MNSALNIASATTATQAATWAPPADPFKQLAQALQSGNLAAAQKAFAEIQANAPQGATSQTTSGTTAQATQGTGGQGGTRPAAFAALGQALQSGNLAAAQQAFAQLQQAGGHHHHHRGGQGAGAATPAAAPTGDTLNITNNSGTINEILASGSSGAGTPGETINITGNTGTINIIA